METPGESRFSQLPQWQQTLIIVLSVVAVLALLIALVLFGRSKHWDTGTSVGVAGLVVALSGFGLAIVEIRRAKSAAKATKVAVTRTLRGVEAIELVRLIEQLRYATTDLDDAVEREDPVAIRHAITTWRRAGSDANGAIGRRFGTTFPALETLETATEGARTTMEALRADNDSGLESAKKALAAMDKAIDDLGPLHQRLLPTIEELNERS